MRYLRESTAATVVVGPFLAKADGFTPVTNLTTGSNLNGRAVSNVAGAAYDPATFVHDANGHYLAALAAGDVPAAGQLRLSFSDPATYLPVWEDFTVLAPAVYDALFGTVAPSTYAGGPVASVTGGVAGSVGSVANLTPVPTGGGLGAVTAVASQTRFTASGVNQLAGAYGPNDKLVVRLRWTGGANAGTDSTVAANPAPGVLTLDFAPAGTVTEGDTFLVL